MNSQHQVIFQSIEYYFKINFNNRFKEIKRVPLNSLLLQMIAMGLKDVRK